MKRIISILTDGKFWAFKCLLVAIGAALVFSCIPEILIQREIPLPPAYALKSDHPLADTSQLTVPAHDGERLHGAKLTARLTGSILLWSARKLTLNSYTPATVLGLFFILSGILIGTQLTKDRLAGLLVGLLFAGLYTTSACFSINWMPKPFDGVAIGMLGLTIILLNRYGFLFLSAFISCWADERAILGLFFISILATILPPVTPTAVTRRLLAIFCAVIVYAISRWLVGLALEWAPSNTDFMIPQLKLSIAFLQLAAWSALEGGWILLVAALYAITRNRRYKQLVLFLIAIGVAISSSVVVIDTSRVGAFAFPLILAAIGSLKYDKTSPSEIRRLLGLGAFISLLAPNFEIIVGVAVKWLPSYLAHLLTNI